MCARDPKDRTCGVSIDPDGNGVAHCFRCEYVEHRRADGPRHRPGPLPRRIADPVPAKTLSGFGKALWQACRPLAGPALAYLQARSCVIPPQHGHLRYHPELGHPPSGIAAPALVALVTDAITGAPLTLHRTWICADGRKAALEPARMLLAGHRKAGGVVRLWPDEDVSSSLGIAEGIETALSLAHAFDPVWACIDAGNMAALPVLPGISTLLVACDNDPAGIEAANGCGQRWSSAGRSVYIAMPGQQGQDMNDLAQAS